MDTTDYYSWPFHYTFNYLFSEHYSLRLTAIYIKLKLILDRIDRYGYEWIKEIDGRDSSYKYEVASVIAHDTDNTSSKNENVVACRSCHDTASQQTNNCRRSSITLDLIH